MANGRSRILLNKMQTSDRHLFLVRPGATERHRLKRHLQKTVEKKRAVKEQQTDKVVEKQKIPKKSVSKAVSKTKAVKNK